MNVSLRSETVAPKRTWCGLKPVQIGGATRTSALGPRRRGNADRLGDHRVGRHRQVRAVLLERPHREQADRTCSRAREELGPRQLGEAVIQRTPRAGTCRCLPGVGNMAAILTLSDQEVNAGRP